MAISVFFRTNTKYNKDPMQAVVGEIIEALMTLQWTAAGFTTTGLGDLPVGLPQPGVGRAVASGGIPPGKWRIRTDLSRLKCPAGAATATLDLGLAAYTKGDGTSQALQGTLLATAVVITAAIDQNLATVTPVDVDSFEGIGVVSAVGTANSPSTGTLIASLVLQKL